MATGDAIKNLIYNPNNTTGASTLPYNPVNSAGPSLLQNTVQGNQSSDADTLYKNAYNATTKAQQTGNVNDINSARSILDAMKGTTADTVSNGVNTFSSILDNIKPQPTTPQVKDNSTQISQMYDQSLAAAQAALKASIQASMGNYQQTIANAPSQFQPLKNQASAAGASNMQNLREMLANGGQQGGVNRTEETNVNSATENNIISLDQQQKQVISEAQKAINDLQAQGDIKGAELVAQNASDRIRALIDEANRVDSTSYSRYRDNVADTGYLSNGTQTIQGKTSDAQIKASEASTAYQNLLNANYPQEEALKIAGILAQNQGLELDNNAKALANQYQPQILQGQIDGQKLQNNYQALVNAGYPAEQASKIALTNAQISAANRSNTAATAKAPSVTQQNANAKANAQQLTGDIQTYLDSWASGKADGQSGRAGQSDMLNYLKANSGILTQQGVDVNALATWVKNNYTWDKVNGEWKNLSD